MRSFAYEVFYQSPHRVGIIRNLLELILKGKQELASKLTEPYILKQNLKHEGLVQYLLISEVKATYKRAVINALFTLVMSRSVDMETSLAFLATFNKERLEHEKSVKQDDNSVIGISSKLNEATSEWHHLIFPDFNYESVTEEEYQQISEYLIKAFQNSTIDNGSRGDKKGLNLEYFALMNLPAKLSDSIKDKDRYQQLYAALIDKNTEYGTITDEVALGICFDNIKFKESHLELVGYLTFSQSAQWFGLSHHVEKRLSEAFFNVGLLFIRESIQSDFVNYCTRYTVVKNNGEIDEHAINTVLNILMQVKQSAVTYKLPPLEIVRKPPNPQLQPKEVSFTQAPVPNAVAAAPIELTPAKNVDLITLNSPKLS